MSLVRLCLQLSQFKCNMCRKLQQSPVGPSVDCCSSSLSSPLLSLSLNLKVYDPCVCACVWVCVCLGKWDPVQGVSGSGQLKCRSVDCDSQDETCLFLSSSPSPPLYDFCIWEWFCTTVLYMQLKRWLMFVFNVLLSLGTSVLSLSSRPVHGLHCKL